jgi:hypothetical protein
MPSAPVTHEDEVVAYDPEKVCARRVKSKNGPNRVTVLPPEGHGDAWVGASRRSV